MFGKIAKTLEVMQSDIHSGKIESKNIRDDINSIKEDLRSIDNRLNRLEGAFFERGQWEARSYKMVKSKPGDK